MTTQHQLKQLVAEAAKPYIRNIDILGIGSGSTVDCFIDAISDSCAQLEGVVAASLATERKLNSYNIPIIELNTVQAVDLYIDGADSFNKNFYLIKGGGGALTREKIITAAAKSFICLVDETKKVDLLGEQFPVPVEVLPMARSFVARELVKLGGQPIYRQGVVTDNGNVIVDVHGLSILDPIGLEKQINNIPGVIANGIFAQYKPNKILMATESGVETLSS